MFTAKPYLSADLSAIARRATAEARAKKAGDMVPFVFSGTIQTELTTDPTDKPG